MRLLFSRPSIHTFIFWPHSPAKHWRRRVPGGFYLFHVWTCFCSFVLPCFVILWLCASTVGKVTPWTILLQVQMPKVRAEPHCMDFPLTSLCVFNKSLLLSQQVIDSSRLWSFSHANERAGPIFGAHQLPLLLGRSCSGTTQWIQRERRPGPTI